MEMMGRGLSTSAPQLLTRASWLSGIQLHTVAAAIQLHLEGQEPIPSARFLELVFKYAVKRPS